MWQGEFKIHGSVEPADMPRVVRCIDVGVFPVTGNETFGMGNVEMLAMGVPVRGAPS